MTAALFLVMWQRAILSDPGAEGKRPQGNSAVEDGQRALAKGEYFSAHRLCYTCWRIRGPRSKHCPMVGQCVDGFDHYCVFIDNTVGKGNHRIFLMVLITEVSMQLMFSFMYAYALKAVLGAEPYTGKRWHVSHLFSALMFNSFVSLGLLGLCKQQWTGVFTNLTYYEFLKRQSTPHFWPEKTGTTSGKNRYQN